MEHIIEIVLTRFADSQQVVTTRHGRSCLTNLLNSSEQWTRALDKKAAVDVIYFDLRKAFDGVPHLKLL